MGSDKEDSEVKFHSSASWLCSSRVSLALFVFLGVANMYALRVNMSVAMVCMINQTAVQHTREPIHSNTTESVDGRCEINIDNGNITGKIIEDGEFTWNKQTQALILGSFFWGYIVTQIPGGWLAVKFGGKRIFGWCMFMCSVSTLLAPVAARTSAVFLLVLRVMAGLGQGVVFPAMHALWAYWAPPLERSKLIGFSFAGAQLGVVLTFPVAGLLCKYGFDNGWPSIFYILASLGMLWFLFWMIFAHDTPEGHPRITKNEKQFIQSSLKGQNSKCITKNVRVPWKSILTSGPVWAIIVAHFCGNWTTYTFLTNMPTYLQEIFQFDIKQNGFVSAIPYVGIWITTFVSGVIADTIRSKEILTSTQVRKLNCALGMLVPAIVLICIGYLNCHQWILAVILITISVSMLGFGVGAGYVVNHADVAPKFASLLFGLSNTAATVPGFMAPYVIGSLTTHQTQEEWRIVFFIAAAVTSFGFVFYMIFGSGNLQEWAQVEEDVKQVSTSDDVACAVQNDVDNGKECIENTIL